MDVSPFRLLGYKDQKVATVDENMIRYRAAIIAEKQGIPLNEAMVVAAKEEADNKKALKKARNEIFGAKSKRLFKQMKKKNKKTICVVGGNVVDQIVSGGLPSLGKRR